jgi:myo-inositol-1-phosphate synthase
MDRRDKEPVNVMIAGICGMTGAAFTAGTLAMAAGRVPVRYGVTGHRLLADQELPGCGELVISGWDISGETLLEALTRYAHIPSSVVAAVRRVDVDIYAGVTTALDYSSNAPRGRQPGTLAEGVALIRADIERSQQLSGARRTIVVYLGSPSLRPPDGYQSDLLDGPAQQYPGSLIYALGAVASSADFIDFTPGFALEYEELWKRASASGSQLAGRDGSTGQTMLKETIAELMDRRGIPIEAWYSTNVLGNNDGRALVTPGYGTAKFADKKDVLPLGELRHEVDIRYMPTWGDRKESWDAVEMSTWLGQPLSLRVNWRGSDSELAGAMILDLVRIMSGIPRMPGFRPELGFFFKRPFLRENLSLSDRWMELVSTVSAASR